jgi:homoserine kinase type II
MDEPVQQRLAPVTAPPARLREVTAAFGVGDPLEVRHLPNGLMNDNWAIATEHGQYALKRLRDVSADTARRNLRVLAAIATAGVPACIPLTAGGEPVVIVDSDAYCLLPWVSGTHLLGTDLTLSQTTELGRAVGQLHQVLNADGGPLPPPGRARSTPITIEHALAEADRFAKAARERWTPFDRQVIELLEQRCVLLTKHSQDQPLTDDPAGPHGWTHGDLQHRNLIWDDGRLTAILDWDRIRIRPLAEEVIRTATILFGAETGILDLQRTSAFVAGYQAITGIDSAALNDALHRLWWKRLTDFWQLVFHYDRADTSCDHLFAINETFLHWWTENQPQVRQALFSET